MPVAYVGIAGGGLGNKIFSVANGQMLRTRGFDVKYFSKGTAHGWTYEFLKKNIFKGMVLCEEPAIEPIYFNSVWSGIKLGNVIKVSDKRLITSRFFNETPSSRYILRDFFDSTPRIDGKIFDMYGTEEWEDTVSIHVRRGDYLRHPVVFNLLDATTYYGDAIEKIGKNHRFIAVSDDIEYCKKVLPKFGVKELLFHKTPFEGEEGSLLDLFLPAFCRYNITSNSTFSWWSAFLNCNDDYVVTAPAHWSKDPSDKWNPGYPVEWKVINYKAH